MRSPKYTDVLKAAAVAGSKLTLKAYMVGGSVRRLLTGEPVTDIDLVVDATGGASKLAEAMAKALTPSSAPTSINILPTWEVRFGGIVVQINEPRRNGGSLVTSIYAPLSDRMKADSLRRDFTVNTLLLPVESSDPAVVIDPLAIGIHDLKHKVLRTPIDPFDTLTDDPIRMLRAARFAIVEDFDIDEELELAIQTLAPVMAEEPGEKINTEFTKIITSSRPADGIRLLARLNLLDKIFPEIAQLADVEQMTEYHDDDVFTHTLKVLDSVDSKLRLRLAALFHDVGKAATRKVQEGKAIFHGHQHTGAEQTKAALQRLRYSNKLIEDVMTLVEMHMIAYRTEWSDSAVRRLIRHAGELLEDLLFLYRADILARKEPHNNLKFFDHLTERIKSIDLEEIIHVKSPLKGEEVMQILKLSEGPEVGEAQKAIEQAIVDGKISPAVKDARRFLIKDYSLRLRGRT